MPTQGEPLRALLAVIEGELERIEADTAVLYDNWFIETCDEWVVPYIGDLLGVRPIRADRVGRRQRARLRRQHDRLPAAQGHRGRARAARARHDRLAGARGRVLHAARDHAAHEPRAARADRRRRACAMRQRAELADSAVRSVRAHARSAQRGDPRRALQHPERRPLPVAAAQLRGRRGRPRRRIARLRERTRSRRLVERSIRPASTAPLFNNAAHRDDDHAPRRRGERAGPAAAPCAERRARTPAPRHRDARAASS